MLTKKEIKTKFNFQTTLFEKSNFCPKFNFDKTPTFSQVQILAKKSKISTFSQVFPKKIDNFLGKLKLNFWTKNEDFEQCASIAI